MGSWGWGWGWVRGSGQRPAHTLLRTAAGSGCAETLQRFRLGFGLGSVSTGDLDRLVSHRRGMPCYKGLSERGRV